MKNQTPKIKDQNEDNKKCKMKEQSSMVNNQTKITKDKESNTNNGSNEDNQRYKMKEPPNIKDQTKITKNVR